MELSTDFWVGALIRRAEQAGAYATVAAKGDPRAGAVLVKVRNPRTGEISLFAEARRGDGESVWMRPSAAEGEDDLDAYAARARRIDPDLWGGRDRGRPGPPFPDRAGGGSLTAFLNRTASPPGVGCSQAAPVRGAEAGFGCFS